MQKIKFMESFKSLGVKPSVNKALAELKINEPTEIQSLMIPKLLNRGTDMIGNAPTGTGKTIAYAIPLIQQINSKSDQIQALIIAPTRELCQQISKQIFKLTKFTEPIFVEKVIGGEYLEKQLYRLSKKTHIIVATPGRLLELINTNKVNLNEVKTVIIDEADEIINMGFKQELDSILNVTNQKAFTWMISATFPTLLQKMVKKYLSKDYLKLQVGGGNQLNKNILHQYFVCDDSEKKEFIHQFILQHSKVKGIVFARSKYQVEEIQQFLTEQGLNVGMMHGDLVQSDREKYIRMLKTGKIKTMVSTDISSRGLDIEDIAYILHYDVPKIVETYVHRSGRTARGNNRGISVSFVNIKEVGYLKKIETLLKIKFNKVV